MHSTRLRANTGESGCSVHLRYVPDCRSDLSQTSVVSWEIQLHRVPGGFGNNAEVVVAGELDQCIVHTLQTAAVTLIITRALQEDRAILGEQGHHLLGSVFTGTGVATGSGASCGGSGSATDGGDRNPVGVKLWRCEVIRVSISRPDRRRRRVFLYRPGRGRSLVIRGPRGHWCRPAGR